MKQKRMIAIPPEDVEMFGRRQLFQQGAALTGYLSLGSLFGTSGQAQSTNYQLARNLIWIRMAGGWDTLETTDPKANSTADIQTIYGWDQAHQLTGADAATKVGRWFPKIATHGEDIVLLRGMAMGTNSHNAGTVYMDTGVLSNAGRVASASIPAIVASEGEATIPMIVLNGGQTPQTDRGLLNPVSVVRANNLSLYRSMYPTENDAIERSVRMLDYLKNSLTRVQDERGSHDRLNEIVASEEKVRRQFLDNVGLRLQVEDEDIQPFLTGAPTGFRRRDAENFALALKLLRGGVCNVMSLGIGGFDTHSNQTANLQPILTGTDHVLDVFLSALKSSGLLDTTLVVLHSEFARTPKVNNSNGRDHWSVGGAMMIGGGIQGGRAVGATDDSYRAMDIDLETGLPLIGGAQLNPTHFAGSLLELTLGASYAGLRTYLESIPALTRLKTA
ncbi:MAG: DUF1501 domain-containing protein [Oligoflexales bacterium]